MKKISMLLLAFMLTVGITGCGTKEDIVTTKTCTKQNEGYHETYKLTATNDEIEKIELIYLYDNSLFGVETLSTLDEATKEQIKTNMLNTLGLESTTYEGFEVNIDIQHQMTVTINADLTKADADVLKKVGLDFSKTNMSLKTAVAAFKSDGSTCN